MVILDRNIKAGFMLRIYARIRWIVHTPSVRTHAEEFILVELSRPALIFHPIKCVWEGHAQPTDIDAMLICTRIRAYVHTYDSQRICATQFWPSGLPSIRALVKSKSMNPASPFPYGTSLFQSNYVNIVAADARAPCVARSSARILLRI